MAKFGITAGTDPKAESIKLRQVSHQHVPGVAFEIDDPANALIHIIGGGFFNEPKYYDTNRSTGEFIGEIATKGRIQSVITDEDGISEQARDLIGAMIAVCESADPEDALIIARWVRKDLNIRTTPAILLAVAAHYEGSRAFVKNYAPHILSRADDIVQSFAAYRHFYQRTNDGLHKGTLPASLRKGIVRAFQNQSIFQLMKYNNTNRPNLADVLLMVKQTKQNGKGAVSHPVFEYMVNDKVMANAPKLIRLRQQFYSIDGSLQDRLDVARDAGLTWENVVSHLGSSREIWEGLIKHGMMGYMALLRNLRNFEQARITDDVWKFVHNVISNFTDNKQLPFRFYSAYQEVTNRYARDAVSIALDNACETVPKLDGITFAMTDNSGSALGCAISGQSKLTVSDAGNMLCAIIAKSQGPDAITGVFGDHWIELKTESNQATMTIKKKLDALGKKCGGGTETGIWVALDRLTKDKTYVDRIILLSDLCCYTEADQGDRYRVIMSGMSRYKPFGYNCGVDMRKQGFLSEDTSIAGMIHTYRKKVNPDVHVYSVNLSGMRQSQLDPDDKKVHLLSGWSESIFSIIKSIETPKAPDYQQVQTETKKPSEGVPTIEVLREKFKVQA